MAHQKIALDFGTTNSVIARWDADQQQAEVLALPGLSLPATPERPALIPSLLYVEDGTTDQLAVGQTVLQAGWHEAAGQRLFRNFKRGLIAPRQPPPRHIDGQPWTDATAGTYFIRTLLQALPYQASDIEQVVVTAPVEAFEQYLSWLTQALPETLADQVRVVDESTAAALGYAVTEPDALVLVVDFGGGTLDLSLVQLPENRARTGGFLKRLQRRLLKHQTARVIAKAGQRLGGSDVDHWLLTYLGQKLGLEEEVMAAQQATILTACEQAKIALSTLEETTLSLEISGTPQTLTLTRTELEALLTENGFYTTLRRAIEKVMVQARRQGIFREDIHYILLVGGTSLMPSVQSLLMQIFSSLTAQGVDGQGITVRADKPFTAVAEGALQVAAGFGLEDYLIHSYGLRHLDPNSNTHRYEEIIPMGTRYPTANPIELRLGTAHPDQSSLEFVIAEINPDAATAVAVEYKNGQAIFVAQDADVTTQISLLHQETVIPLNPPSSPGKDRLTAQFSVDAQRRLRLTVIDLQTQVVLLNDAMLTTLK